jgi:1,4-alpha-glucan branching enzyme
VKTLVRDLNHLYRCTGALYERDNEHEGFSWIDHQDVENSSIAFVRHGRDPRDVLIAVCNFTPVVRYGYRIGVPPADEYEEVFNSDSARYGGSNVGNLGRVRVEAIPSHGREQSVSITLPPLAAVYFRPVRA